MGESRIHELSYYLPRSLLDEIILSYGSDLKLKRTISLQGGVLFFDLANFTPLTAALVSDGIHGAEQLQRIMEEYYTLMIDIIYRYGGTVYYFAGDAAMTTFERFESESNEKFCRRLIGCCVEMRDSLSQHPAYEILGREYKLETKFSIEIGPCSQITLGEKEGEYLVSVIGETIEAAANAENSARPGDIILGKRLIEQLDGQAEYESSGEIYRLVSLKASPSEGQFTNRPVELKENHAVSPGVIKKISSFIHPAVIEKVVSGDQRFMAENRDVSSVFIRLNLDDNNSSLSDKIKAVRYAYHNIYTTAEQYGGALIQCDFSDKGEVFLVLFGAPRAVENKELMAVRFGVAINKKLCNSVEIDSISVGISSGLNYFGNVGSRNRKGFTVLGTSVNLAARIMMLGPGIHLDQNTAQKIDNRFEMSQLRDVKLKGINSTHNIFRLGEEKQDRDEVSTKSIPLLGRKSELQQLLEPLDRLLKQGSVVAVTGETGVGKSYLSESFLAELKNREFRVANSSCYPYEKNTPLFPWSQLVKSIFELTDELTLEESESRVRGELSALGDIDPDWSPLLLHLAGVNVADTYLTQNLEPKERHERVNRFLIRILQHKSSEHRLVLVIDDFHWCDENSNRLLELLIKQIPENLFILLIARDEENLKQFSDYDYFKTIHLGELNPEDALNLIQQQLNLERSEPVLEKIILNKAQGNPFYIESIVLTLRENGVLQPVGEHYRLSGEISEDTLPHNLHDVVMSRIDTLSEDEKITLKTASVIGRSFSYKLIESLTGSHVENGLKQSLQVLNGHSFTEIQSRSPLTYSFKNSLIRDVAYNSIISMTRKEIHRNLAEIIEDSHESGDIASSLAYHYYEADEPKKALHYNHEAGKSALQQFANRDAIHFFNQAREIANQLGKTTNSDELLAIREGLAEAQYGLGQNHEAIKLYEECLQYRKTAEQRAFLYLGLGKAYLSLGDSDRAIEWLSGALELLGKKMPSSQAGLILGIVNSLFLISLVKFAPLLLPGVSKKRHQRTELQLEILDHLSKLLFFTEPRSFAWSSLQEVIVAERLRDKEKIAISYSSYGIILAGLGLLKKSHSVLQKSEKFARESGSARALAQSLTRQASYCIYSNEKELEYEKFSRAAELYQEVADWWEYTLAMMLKAMAAFYLGRYREAETVSGMVAGHIDKIDSLMFKAWSLRADSIYKFYQGKIESSRAEELLEESRKISERINVNSGICVALTYRYYIALVEDEYEKMEELALMMYEAARNFNTFLPISQVALAWGADAALIALERGTAKSPEELPRIISNGLKILLKKGDTYPMVKGPALLVSARYHKFEGDIEQARKYAIDAISFLKSQPIPIDLAIAYYYGSQVVVEKKSEYLAEAERIFHSIQNIPWLNKLEREKSAI